MAMHSLRGGAIGPGSYLIDVDQQTAKISKGDVIDVDAVSYVTTRKAFIKKDELGAATEGWEDVPGQLVALTCLQRPDNSASIDNLVVFAQFESAE